MSNGQRRTVCVVLVDRANYARLKPVMTAIAAHDDLNLQVLAAGTMVLERFGSPLRVVEQDGFRIDGHVYLELEGSTPSTMAKSVGLGVIEFANEFRRLAPDVVLIIGDRYEALAAAIAAAYTNFPVVHLQGGEVSGSIDESARHAITKFAHFHVPSTQRSADYVLRMGERPDTILTVGCPSSDIVRHLDARLDPAAINTLGSGITIDVDKPFLTVLFHPTTTEYGGERHQMEELLKAVGEVNMPTLLLWPNIDAGSDHISKVIRQYRDQKRLPNVRTLTNLAPEDFLRVLANTACAIGNSSSFVRDASYLGTPIVLVGNRQEGRETAEHVTPVAPVQARIAEAIRRQVAHGKYAPSDLYGDGHVSERVAEGIARLVPYVQKRLHYIERAEPSVFPLAERRAVVNA